jgi:hypothetical protein
MIVGAAHVVGKEGIISILENKGYKSKQIEVKMQAKESQITRKKH